jgi:hypothetical protein
MYRYFRKYIVNVAIAVGVLSLLFSFAKFEHCRHAGWGPPGDYIHACYSDIPSLLTARGLSTHTWPYASGTQSVEYPPITGIVMWATSFLTPHDAHQFVNYFDVNAFFIAILFLITVYILQRARPDIWYLFPLAPAVVGSLFINWDMWAVLPAVYAIIQFDKKRYDRSAIALGISIATKFFPIVLLLPIALIFRAHKKYGQGLRYLAVATATWLVINLPIALTTPTGWWYFFSFNSHRGMDWGSIWYGFDVFGIHLTNINFLSLFLFILGSAFYALYFLALKRVPKLSQTAFFMVALFTIASKVYSPQYILWLTPVAVLAMSYRNEKRDWRDFWIWQGCELIYHIAIWEFLAVGAGARFGISTKVYAVALFARVIALIWFTIRLGRESTPEIAPQTLEFLGTAIEG